jgi:hypothetical protein
MSKEVGLRYRRKSDIQRVLDERKRQLNRVAGEEEGAGEGLPEEPAASPEDVPTRDESNSGDES